MEELAPSTLRVTMMTSKPSPRTRRWETEQQIQSCSGKTLAEDVFSVAGDTTLPSYQDEGEEVDSFVSTTCLVVVEEATGAKPSGTPPTEVMTPKRAGKTIVDLSGMEETIQTVDLELEEGNMSLDLSTEKQYLDKNKTNSEADTATGNESLTNSLEEECFKMLNEHYQNKIEDAQTSWKNYTTKKDHVQRP